MRQLDFHHTPSYTSHDPKVNTMGSGARTSLVGKRLVVTMKPLEEMHKPVDKPVARMQGTEELVKSKVTSLEIQDNDLIIGCSEKLVMPIFW